VIGLYRALLRLYPASFRAEYGDELCAAFAESVRDASPARTFLSAFADVIPNAIAAHFDIVKQDLRYAARTLRHSPGFALTAILIVALGIGANTAAFSLADFVLLRPLPYPDSDRLVQIWTGQGAYAQNEVSPPNYLDLKSMSKSFDGMGAYANVGANLSGAGLPRRVGIAQVTPDLLPFIGVPPMLGSVITPRNSASLQIAVLSHDLWRTQFDADRAIVGKVVRLDGKPFTVIGVMPPSFRFPARNIELWTPILMEKDDWEDRGNNFFRVVGKLKPGVTVEQAGAELATISARLVQQYPSENEEMLAWTHRLRDGMGPRARMLVIALCGASLCILLLACANLASLLLARGAHRAHELAIRTALGAGRERLVRQLVTETILLATIGGAAGVFLAWTVLPLLTRLVPPSLPVEVLPTIDLRVLAFAAVLIVITGLGFGVVPALREQKIGRRQRLRSALVVLEVTGSIVLLISSGLLMRAIWRIQANAPGFRTDGVLTMYTALPTPKYGPVAMRERFYRRVLEEVRAIPGVTNAAYTTGLPMVRTGGIRTVEIPGVPRDNDETASLRYATPGLFATLGIPLIRGRDIADIDTQDRKPYVAVISESLAKRHWPNQDPLGRTFKFGEAERTVVGVVGDIRVRGLEQTSEPQVYIPSAQIADNTLTGYAPQALVIRATLPVEQFLPSVRRIVAAADPEQPISEVKPLEEIVADNTAPRRVQLRVLAILSAIALLIAGVGIHGLLSLAIAQRTKELGVRRALGAQASAMVGMVLREGFRLTVIGGILGVIVAIMVGRAMSALLFGVAPTDAQTIVAAVALCSITALLGCLRPALRAARVDPMVALRES